MAWGYGYRDNYGSNWNTWGRWIMMAIIIVIAIAIVLGIIVRRYKSKKLRNQWAQQQQPYNTYSMDQQGQQYPQQGYDQQQHQYQYQGYGDSAAPTSSYGNGYGNQGSGNSNPQKSQYVASEYYNNGPTDNFQPPDQPPPSYRPNH